MRNRPRLTPIRVLSTVIAVAACTASAQTTNGTWTNLSGGSWAVGTNWSGGNIASGTDALADFSTLNITTSPTVTLDGAVTVGSLKFGDATTLSNDWTVAAGTGGVLTLDVATGASQITVVNRTATITASLAGNDGINVSGGGILSLGAANTFTGQLTVASGATLSVTAVGAMGASGVGNETVISSGGVLNLAGATNTNWGSEIIRVIGSGINNTGAITAIAGTTTVQNITLTGNTTFGGTSRYNISGGTLDLGGFKLTKVGTNQVAIPGGTVTSGDIDITAGILSFEATANVKGTGTVSVSSGAVLGLWNNVSGSQTRPVSLNAGSFLRELGSNASASTFSSPLTLKGNSTVDVLPGTGGLTNLILNGGIGENGGSFGFTKTGTGKLTIAGTNTFTGALNLNVGTTALALGATLNTAAINVAPSAVFDVSAGGLTLGAGQTLAAGRNGAPASDVIGAVTANAGSLINVGGTSLFRTMSVAGDVTLNDSSVQFDLGGTTTVGSDVNDLLAVTGNVTLAGTNTINIRTAGSSPVPGTYTLVTYGGALNGNVGNFAVNAPSSTRQTFTPSTATPGAITLQIAGAAADLTWVGNGTSNVWDLNNSATFTDGSVAQKFFNLDTVNFTDSGLANSSVTLSGTLQPAAVAVNSTGNYTFGGTGILTGSTQLTKSGTGKLTIAGGAHDFTGGVTVTGGSLSTATLPNNGQAGPLGLGTVTLAGGVLEYTGPTASSDRTLTLGTGGGTLSVFDPATTLTLTGSPTGANRFTKAGAGTLLVNYAGAYTGGTTIAEGTLKLANTNGLGATGTPAVSVSNGATLEVNGLTPATKIALTIAGAGVDGLGALRNSGVGVINNNIASSVTLAADATVGTGSRYDFVGAVTFNGGTFTLTKAGAGETWWSPAANATVGNIVVNGGRFGVQSSNNLGDTSYAITVNSGAMLSTYGAQTNAKQIVLNGGTLHNNNGGVEVGKAGTWTGSLTLNDVGTANRIDTANGPIVASGKITGLGGFEKLNTGATLYPFDISNPANDWLGDTQVTAGTLRIVGSGKISPNSALVMNGANATFDGASTIQSVTGLRGTAGTVTNVGLTVSNFGTDTFNGSLTGASTALTKAGAGNLILTGTGNSYSGATTVSAGTLTVAGAISGTNSLNVNSGGSILLSGTSNVGAGRINDSAAVNLGSGSSLFGLDPFATIKIDELVGALTLGGSAIVDFGINSLGGVLRFADSSTLAGSWNGSLKIYNWTSGGTDQLFFGNSQTALTPSQLGQITFYSDNGATPLGSATFLTGGQGEIVPVPEPSTLHAAVAALAMGGWLRRRKRSA